MRTLKGLLKRTIRGLWYGAEPVDVRAGLAHPPLKGMPRVSLVSRPAVDRGGQVASAQRLIRAYKRTAADQATAMLPAPQDDLWTRLIDSEFESLRQMLDSEDAVALADYLLHFGEQYTWFGGLTLSIDGFTHQRSLSAISLAYLDKLVSLAEALGVLPLENPEQSPDWGANLYVDVEQLLGAIEEAAGVPAVPPAGVVPVTGIATSRGPLHYRHLNALYAALRVRDLLPDGGAVCEYGGGLGLVAYYAAGLGLKEYTIFDLPLVNVFSGHFLIGSLGGQAVRLYGEAEGTAGCSVLPYWQCVTVPSRVYSLALNQDSFPEIDPSLLQEYIRQIHRTSVGYFLSINQEAQASMGGRKQNSVPGILRGHDGFSRVYRMKYWLREGYVEELYRIRR